MNTRKLMTTLFIIYLGCVVIQYYQKNGLTEVVVYWETTKEVIDNILK